MFPTADVSEQRETAAMIALVRRGGRAWHHYADLVESTGSALEVLDGGGLSPADEPPSTLFDLDPAPQRDKVDLDPIEAEVRGWEDDGIRVLSVLDRNGVLVLAAAQGRREYALTVAPGACRPALVSASCAMRMRFCASRVPTSRSVPATVSAPG